MKREVELGSCQNVLYVHFVFWIVVLFTPC